MSSYRWEDVVGPTLLKCNGEEVPTSLALSGKKYVMLYMSAHWCPPCRHFTPQLVAAYEAHKRYLEEGGGGDFNANTDDDSVGEIEVIFVSFDSVKSEYDNYRNTMPWLSVPFANLHRWQIKDILSKKYSIVGIPALIIIDGNSGKLVSTNGRELYIDYFKGEYPSTSSSWGCILS
ncbi:hypothetical protein ACHAXH_002173 [Discostella pseudostelligera]